VNFKQRLLRYGAGVIIGVLMSVVIFSGRGCSDWLPEKRIKSRIQLDGIELDAVVSCAIRCWEDEQGKPSPLEGWLLDAEIDWSVSGPRETPQRYVFNLPAEAPLQSVECRFSQSSGLITKAVFRIDADRCQCADSAHSAE
jgi:hypothetical protein|tara:strand:+ start:459 stop:881 length:423 start_codon:yes stop_codon:yes gene_type:complete